MLAERLSKNFRLRVPDRGRVEWWAYGTLLAWCALVPAAIWAVGQTVATATGLQSSVAAAKSVPKVQRRPLGKADMEVVTKTMLVNFPEFRVAAADGGVLHMTASTPDKYPDWVMAMAFLSLIHKRTVWTIGELCMSSEAPNCQGGAIYVELKGERIAVIGE